MFCKATAPVELPIVAERRASFLDELDFHREAKCMEQVADSLAQEMPQVFVPRPIAGLVTKTVLVMTLVPGTSLQKAMAHHKEEATADKVAAEERNKELRRQSSGVIICGELATLFGTIFLEAKESCGLGCASFLKQSLQHSAERAVGLRLSREICKTLGHLVLVEGLVPGDPHPGNFMVLPDGRLGMIDFGQTMILSKAQRLMCNRFWSAMRADNEVTLINFIRNDTMFRTKSGNPHSVLAYFRLVNLPLEEFKPELISEMEERDPWVTKDATFGSIDRCILIMRLVCAALGAPVEVSHEWGRIADNVLAQLEC